MNFFTVGPAVFWGDCGRILASGLTRRGRDSQGRLILERSGPFVPPISFPSKGVIATGEFKLAFQQRFRGCSFLPVVKHHTPVVHWEGLDRSGVVPEQFLGAVEGHILDQPHSEVASKQIGELWELQLPEGGVTTSVRDRATRKWNVTFDPKSWTGSDLFMSATQRILIATSAGASWLKSFAGDWLTIAECVVNDV